MQRSKSAQKQARAAEKRRVRNKSTLSQVKTKITGAERVIFLGEKEAAGAAVVAAISSLDKAAEKGIIHPNNAARRKSRLMKKLNQALASSETKAESEQSK